MVYVFLIPVLVAILFIYFRFYSLKLYKNQKSYWWLFFYGVYLLFLLDFLMVLGEEIFIFVILFSSPFVFLAILISDIILLVKSYKLKPRLAYFYNLLVLMIIITIPLLLAFFWFLLQIGEIF